MKLSQRYDNLVNKIPKSFKEDMNYFINFTSTISLYVIGGIAAAIFAGYLLKAGCSESGKNEPRSEPSPIEVKLNQE